MKATVIITSYNRAHLLPQAVDSVLNQDYDDIQIIIADDNSNKETQEVCEDYNAKYDNITYYQSNRKDEDRLKSAEFAENINACIPLVEGEVVFYLTDDDYYYPEHVSEIMAAFKEHSDWMMAYAPQKQNKYNDDTGEEWTAFVRAPGYKVPQASCQLDHNQVAHRTSVYDTVGGWPTEPEHRGAADAAMWDKINRHWPAYRATTKITNVHRHHRDSIQGPVVWP